MLNSAGDHAKVAEQGLILNRFMDTLSRLGRPLSCNANILDFGCGAGNMVRAMTNAGFNAYGFDIALTDDPNTNELISSGIVRTIHSTKNYQLPFSDNTFDVIISNQVFEHVQDYDVAIREIARILKPDGISLHMFPSRYVPVEPHVYVPLATIWQNYGWLRLWASLGIRNEYQVGFSAIETTRKNFEYLRNSTNYLTRRHIASAFAKHFDTVDFVEKEFYRRFCIFLPMARLISAFRSRVVYTEGPRK